MKITNIIHSRYSVGIILNGKLSAIVYCKKLYNFSKHRINKGPAVANDLGQTASGSGQGRQKFSFDHFVDRSIAEVPWAKNHVISKELKKVVLPVL